MEETKFRAIGSVDTNWYYGQYVKCNSYKETVDCIVDDENNFLEIDPDTIGRFTGRYDKFKTEVYESDIIAHDYGYGVVKFGRFLYDTAEDRGLEFIGFYVEWNIQLIAGNRYEFIGSLGFVEDLEVIGNIYKDSKFLKTT